VSELSRGNVYRKSPSSTSRSLLLILLLLLAPLSSIQFESTEVLKSQDIVSSSITFSQGSGDELIGDTLTLNNSDWTVRAERGFDDWSAALIENGSSSTGEKMIIVDDLGRMHGCWSEGSNGIWMFKTEVDGNLTTQQVDNTSAMDGCALAIDAQDNLFITWADSQGELHVSREAKKGAMNFGRTFLTRALIDSQVLLPLNIGFTDGKRATIVWKSAEDSTLWATNHTGTYWMTRQVVSEPVGVDIEMITDSDGVLNVAYTSGNDVRILRFNETIHDDKVLLRADSDMMTSRLGFALDAYGNPQVAYEGDDGVMILRSLSGQSTGRVEPAPVSTVNISDMDYEEPPTLISDSDFNGDGTTELVIANPLSETGSGSIVVYPGTRNRSILSESPDAWYLNGSSGEGLGMGVAAGDFDGDGIDDLAVGVPYRGNNSTMVGYVELYQGTATGLGTTPYWNWTLNETEAFTASSLANAGDIDGDGDDELLIVSSNYSSSNLDSEIGRVDMFLGSSSWGQVPDWTLNCSAIDTVLGIAIAGGGDVNGDGYDDVAISSTGTRDSPMGFSTVEVFFGSASGFSISADHRIEQNVQGKLFGHELVWVDLDGNGFDELVVGEPFNGSAYQSGKIWIFNGTISGLELPDPLTTISSNLANDLFGSVFESAGDVNEDGYEDLLISHRGVGKIGSLSLYLGSQFGILTTPQTLVQGSEQGDMVAATISTGGDYDDDGMSEIVVLEFDNIATNNNGWVNLLTERDWATSSLGYGGISISDIEIGSSFSGVINILIESTIDEPPFLLQHMDDGTPEGHWLERSFESFNSPSMATLVSGAVVLFAHGDDDSVVLLSHSSRQLVEQTTITTGNIGAWVDIEIDGLNHPSIMHARVDTSEIYWTRASSGGWSTSLVIGSVDLDASMTQLIDDDNKKWVIYRDSSDASLNAMHRPLNSWTSNILVSNGLALSDEHAAVLLSNDSLAVLSIVDDGGNDSLNFTILNGSTLSTESLNASPNRDAHFAIVDFGDRIHAIWQNSTDGECVGMSRASNGTNWSRDWSWFANTTVDAPLLVLDSSSSPGVVCSGGSGGTDRLADLTDSTLTQYDIESDGSSIRSFVEADGKKFLIRENSVNGGGLALRSETTGFEMAVVTSISGESVAHADIAASSDGVLHLAFQESTGLDLVLMRLLPDTDGDRIPDTLDGMSTVSGQWEDSDGDGYGDNPDGPGHDDCLSTSGTSIIALVGCLDYDDDLTYYGEDSCSGEGGFSYFDRLGCPDYDRDGWSNNDENWFGGDQFLFNWKQTRDSDGDSRGDNSGPDCCMIYWPDTNWSENHAPDIFPHNKHQWADQDGDGFGDNITHSSGDDCISMYGPSSQDRNGCPDSDGDGYSDPGEFGGTDWDVENGADAFVNDSTQWNDTDEDGYGDNSEAGATAPDHFPGNPSAANDTDDDGYPNNWTAQYNGSNSDGLVLDACPDDWGNATEDMLGCPDRDGDGTSDLTDDFPDDDTQWVDSDGDGWGDNPSGNNPDACPQQEGVENGTGGNGCPLIIPDDEDNDGIIDAVDTCPSTPSEQTVNATGCAESQIDGDSDGVMNDMDDCPDTPLLSEVDSRGCTQTQQNADTDGDNVKDPDDDCPDTPFGEETNDVGCSNSQLDDDNDGISNANDLCPDTTPSAAVDDTGCIVAGADTDGDGVEDSEDILPADASQWVDSDGDGYGDNMSGTDGDACPSVYGTSFEDRNGCIDSDGDRRSDPDALWTVYHGADEFPDDIEQWKDSDKDGFGDNGYPYSLWGDDCPNTPTEWREMAKQSSNGCAPIENDDDGDGIMDLNDACPSTGVGVQVDITGCPLNPDSDSTETESTASGTKDILIYSGAGVGALVLIIIIVSIFRRGEDFDFDDEDEDDDWFDDDDDEDEVFTQLDRRRSTPPAASGGPKTGPGQPPRAGPGGPPPQARGMDPYAGGGYGGPPPGTGGYGFGGAAPAAPRRGPPSQSKPEQPKKKKSVKKKLPTAEEVAAAEQAEARQQNWEPEDEGPLFNIDDEGARQDSVAWAWDEIQFGKDERSIMMGLQGSGWSARQSRAIFDEAKAW